ncbi:MAG: hypothetical protein JNM13_14870 [Hyphomicrobiaceae bacterium]|nr:hypothetical protein [Hyphomicrobiaceae bacterium]
MTDAELAPALRPYETSARRRPLAWGLAACGVVFLTLGLLPVRLCGPLPCPGWVQPFEIGLGAVILAAVLLVLALDTRRGSRIDAARACLCWWTGTGADERGELPLARIARLRLEPDVVRVVDRDGGTHPIPRDCIRAPHAAWLRAMATAWPHIAID